MLIICEFILFYKYLVIIIGIINSCEGKIRLVQATIRHAARNPSDSSYAYFFYPKDPYKDRDWPPEGPMKLTRAGRINAYEFGHFLRDKYSTLFREISCNNINITDNVYFHAINTSRMIDTAKLIASGLLSSTINNNSSYNDSVIDPDLLFTTVNVVPIAQDLLNYPLIFCENYNIDKNRALNEITRLFRALRDVQELFQYLSHHTGVKHTHSTQGYVLYQQLASQAALGLSLEKWTAKIFPNGKLVDITAAEYILQTYTTRMKRLLGGVWIKTFLDHVDDEIKYINNNNTSCDIKHIFLYVSSEIQVAAILNTLGVYKPHVPDYLNTVFFELHQEIDDEYYIKIIYKNSNVMEDLIIPGCQKSYCLLSTFRSVLDDVILKNFDEDCGRRGIFALIGNVPH